MPSFAFVVRAADAGGAFGGRLHPPVGRRAWMPRLAGMLRPTYRRIPDQAAAAAHSPDSPLDEKKAWIEVGHRYIAGLLALLLFAAAVVAARLPRKPLAPFLLAAMVAAQAILGMLTVSEKLQPLIVSAHLLGGMLIFATLAAALTLPRRLGFVSPSQQLVLRHLRIASAVAATALTLQIFLGGWVSTNYAALSCPEFPACQGGWRPPLLDWSGFALGRELHLDSAGEPLTAAAKATVHWMHRLGAVVAAAIFILFGAMLWRANMRGSALGLWALLAAQIALGIVNVVAGLPMWSALMHHAVAALLAAKMAKIITLLFASSATSAADVDSNFNSRAVLNRQTADAAGLSR